MEYELSDLLVYSIRTDHKDAKKINVLVARLQHLDVDTNNNFSVYNEDHCYTSFTNARHLVYKYNVKFALKIGSDYEILD